MLKITAVHAIITAGHVMITVVHVIITIVHIIEIITYLILYSLSKMNNLIEFWRKKIILSQKLIFN